MNLLTQLILGPAAITLITASQALARPRPAAAMTLGRSTIAVGDRDGRVNRVRQTSLGCKRVRVAEPALGEGVSEATCMAAARDPASPAPSRASPERNRSGSHSP